MSATSTPRYLTGYPGSIASAWQQAGRSGRSGERSLSVLVAQDNPLDQYLMRHPESFFGKSHETARISPANPYIMKPHLLCAAYESPLTMNDTEFFGPELLWYADELIEDDYVHVRYGRWHLVPEMTYPAERVNMRTASGAFYTLVDADTGADLGDGLRVFRVHAAPPRRDLPAPGRVLPCHRTRHGVSHRLRFQ